MDGRCVYLFLSICIINILSITNGGKLYIRDSFKVKPFDNRLEKNQLNTLVVNALTTKFKNRKMLDVSKNRYNFHMAWRGLRQFFWKKVLIVFCPSLTRELKALKVLKEMLSNIDNNDNNNVKKKLNLVLPFKKSKSQKKGKKEISIEESDEENDEESDEESDGESDEESDEENSKDEKQNKNKSKKGKNSKKKEDSDEDVDDNDSDEDDRMKKKKKNRKKNLDDLFK